MLVLFQCPICSLPFFLLLYCLRALIYRIFLPCNPFRNVLNSLCSVHAANLGYYHLMQQHSLLNKVANRQPHSRSGRNLLPLLS